VHKLQFQQQVDLSITHIIIIIIIIINAILNRETLTLMKRFLLNYSALSAFPTISRSPSNLSLLHLQYLHCYTYSITNTTTFLFIIKKLSSRIKCVSSRSRYTISKSKDETSAWNDLLHFAQWTYRNCTYMGLLRGRWCSVLLECSLSCWCEQREKALYFALYRRGAVVVVVLQCVYHHVTMQSIVQTGHIACVYMCVQRVCICVYSVCV